MPVGAPACERSGSICAEEILDEEGWPLELIDVETLLDQDTTVIHYLGPRNLDLAPLRARFRSSSGFDVVFEPAGLDPGPQLAGPAPPTGRGAANRCGDCDCSGGGCGTTTAEALAIPEAGSRTEDSSTEPCGQSAHQGCSSCGISKLLSGKRGSRV